MTLTCKLSERSVRFQRPKLMAVSSANSVQRAGMKKKVVYVERKQKRVQYLVVHRILRDSRAREREGEREGERERESCLLYTSDAADDC